MGFSKNCHPRWLGYKAMGFKTKLVDIWLIQITFENLLYKVNAKLIVLRRRNFVKQAVLLDQRKKALP